MFKGIICGSFAILSFPSPLSIPRSSNVLFIHRTALVSLDNIAHKHILILHFTVGVSHDKDLPKVLILQLKRFSGIHELRRLHSSL